MPLSDLFIALSAVCDGPLAIERRAATLLAETAEAVGHRILPATPSPLPAPVLEVMKRADAYSVCALIAQIPFHWTPPTTSRDPAYIAHSTRKVHVELLGPDGLVTSDQIKLGLYGMLPNADYGLRTHPAEEVFIMLAGQAQWKRGDASYQEKGPGARAHHPSGLAHATRTIDTAFMSVYVWTGDISTDGYRYSGIPSD